MHQRILRGYLHCIHVALATLLLALATHMHCHAWLSSITTCELYMLSQGKLPLHATNCCRAVQHATHLSEPATRETSQEPASITVFEISTELLAHQPAAIDLFLRLRLHR